MREPLIFDWPGRHHLHLLLPATLVAAALLHAGLFFVFSIVYPHPDSSGPDPVQVYFVTPSSPDAARLEGLMRSSDSAVFAPGRGLSLPLPFPPAAYTPQYDSDKPALDPLPHAVPAFAPVPVPAGPVPTVEQRAQAAAAGRSVTTLKASPPLAGRPPALPPDTVFFVSGGGDPEPAVFLVAVRGDGSVAHLFPQHSSGDASLDLGAARVLRGLKFSADPTAEAWGFVTFEWGTDVQPMAQP